MKFTFKCNICHREVKGGRKFEIKIFEKVGVCYADSMMIADASCNQCKQEFLRLAVRLNRKASKAGAK